MALFNTHWIAENSILRYEFNSYPIFTPTGLEQFIPFNEMLQS